MVNTMTKRMLFAALALLVSVAVIAAPAPWYQWKSKLNGKAWCAQTSLGDGWERSSGPYKDANCKIFGRPG